MLAVDTNVVVRLLTNDDPGQAARAKRLFETESIFLPLTVLLECEWVLRSAYQLASSTIVEMLTRMSGLPNVAVEFPERWANALDWAGQGMDLADALHLASADGTDGFVTFDRKLSKSAAVIGAPAVRDL